MRDIFELSNKEFLESAANLSFWPINNIEFNEEISNFINSSVKLIRANYQDDSFENNLIKCCNPFFAKKLLHDYYTERCITYFDERKSQNSDFTVLLQFLNHEILEPIYLKPLRHGFRKSQSLNHSNFKLSFIDFIRNLKDRHGFKKTTNIELANNGILSTGGGDIAGRYKKFFKNDVFLYRMESIFPQRVNADSQQFKDERNYLQNSVRFNTFYQDLISLLQHPFSPQNANSIYSWYFEFLTFSSLFFKQLENAKFAPREIWTSSMGILWNSLLAIHGKNIGAKVVTFDHANGANMALDSTTAFIDCQFCDTYVVTSNIYKKYILSSLELSLYNPSNAPEIISIESLERE